VKKIIILSISIILVFISVASAEVIHINCKFNEGWHQKGTIRADVKKMPDLSISLDKEKRIIKATDRIFEPYNTFNDSFHWSHKWTGWKDDYTLNTINGNLVMKGFNKKENWENSFYYTCDKIQKKF
jgi:hypothetical protein